MTSFFNSQNLEVNHAGQPPPHEEEMSLFLPSRDLRKTLEIEFTTQ